MALQYSTTLRNAQLDTIESHIGSSPKLQIRTGAPPANAAAADSGTLLCEMALPADWLSNAAAAAIAKNGTWSGTGVAAGDAGHWRIKDNAGTTTHMQGTATATGGGGDMTLDNVSIAVGQNVTVTAFSVGAQNA